MDGSFISFTWDASLRDHMDLNGIDADLSCITGTALRHNPLSTVILSTVSGNPNFFESESSKWKNGEISLDLDLGLSATSSRSKTNFTAATSLLTSGSSPDDISLDFDLFLGTKRPCNNRVPRTSVKPSENERPKVDLELSLSFGDVHYDLTSVGIKSQTLSNIHQIVDEGSTSAKWKNGALVAQILATSTAEPVKIDDPVTVRPQPRRTNIKKCQFPGCHKGARGASGRCISHGGGRRCQKPGCQKGAEGKTAFCKAHGGGRRCEHLGCTKSAEGRTNLCIAHGGGRRCTYAGGCNHAARGKSGLCIRHGGGKRCKAENCTKSAEGQTGLCIAHGGGRRCQYPECTKGAQGSTKFCKAHGGGKRCTFDGCTKGAEGSTLFCKGHGGGKRCSFSGGGVCTKSVHGGTSYCVAHGGGKRCIALGCTKSARGRTDFCVRHGGGKRCHVEGCGKSAQGRTDFCKAHGGGKQCLWGHTGSGFGEDGVAPCDKFGRGKLGLCTAHKAQVEDERVHDNGTMGLKMKEVAISSLANGFTFEGYKRNMTPARFAIPEHLLLADGPGESSNAASLHEGRVHGGSLMAMLQGG